MSTNQWEQSSSNRQGITYISSDKKHLLIIPHDVSSVERLAQAWLDVNREEAQIIQVPEVGKGIMVKRHSHYKDLSTNEIIHHIIQVYQNSGRILFDKSLALYQDKVGNIYTNNVFYALNLTQKHYLSNPTDKEIFDNEINNLSFQRNNIDLIKCTLKTLIFISEHRPDINNLDYLGYNVSIIITIGMGLHPTHPSDYDRALNSLNSHFPESEELSIVKERCAEILSQYKTLKSNDLTSSSTNKNHKIQALDELIKNINDVHFIEDIIQLLQEFLHSNRNLLLNPHHQGGRFRKTIKECLELPQFGEISSLYNIKENCINALEEFQQSKKTLAWVKSFYSKSQDKISALDGLIDDIVACRDLSELLSSLRDFKVVHNDLFKKQRGDLFTCLEYCENLVEQHIDNTANDLKLPPSTI